MAAAQETRGGLGPPRPPRLEGKPELKIPARHVLALLLAVPAAFAVSPAPAKPMEYICYSPYRNGQAPGGAAPSEAQIEEDFRILAPLVKGIRIYSSRGVHARIPALAGTAGMEVHVGAWIGRDEAANQAEVDALIALAKGGNPAIRGLIVGNEVLLREDVPKARLLEYLRQVRTATAGTGIPVTTADIYQRLNENSADLLPLLDYVMPHVHPFWEHQSAVNAAAHVLAAWRSVKAKYPGKDVIVGETGFPSAGQTLGAAVPGEAAQALFTGEIALLGAREGMTFMLFTSFDEAWKGAEGPVGPNWGIWRADRSEKAAVAKVRALPALVLGPGRGLRLQGAAREGRPGLDVLGRLRPEAPGRPATAWMAARP